MPDSCEAKICEPGGRGKVLPLPFWAVEEQDLSCNGMNWLRVVLYLACLLWLFMGVAIVADIFMGSIERITSKKVLKGKKTVKVWNDTVANLTLMALGSSAPEILLNVIEITFNDPAFTPGGLGASTIVGSAAFNLFCITAVCVACIPENEVRFIKDTSVFTVTATFSIFAYVWLVLIVAVFSPDVVQIWEAAVTFLLFPLLVAMAFAADKGYFSREPTTREHKVSVTEVINSPEEIAMMKMNIMKQHGNNLTDEQLARIMERQFMHISKSRAAYRVHATRHMVGGKRVSHVPESPMHKLSSVVPVEQDPMPGIVEDAEKIQAVFQFESDTYAVLENVGTLSILVRKIGNTEHTATVKYKTRDGTAKAGSDYSAVEGVLTFLPEETEKTINIGIVNDLAYEDDEEFFVDLSEPRTQSSDCCVALGTYPIAKVAIVDDDEPGFLYFEKEALTVCEHPTTNKTTTVKVLRKDGSAGKISCKYRCEQGTATKDVDYEHIEGELEFANGQLQADIALTIFPKGRFEAKEEFRIILTDPTHGARFVKETDGGQDSCICTIIIQPDEQNRTHVDRVMQVLISDYDKAQIGHTNWKDQFRSALLVNGGEDDDPSTLDWILHMLTLPWKVFFAMIPPADYFGGWLCFSMSLVAIALVTALIGDMAELLGCVMNMPPEVTAVTFVALGTSLPDTFASKTAAEQDPHADASIGNVTGSNSVNVFLGIGMPWLMASIYWSAVGRTQEWKDKYSGESGYDSWNSGSGKFIVKSAGLSESVLVFSCCAAVAIGVLCLRRRLYGGELGGPKRPKILTAILMVTLWFVYIGFTVLQSVQNGNSDCESKC